MDPNATLQLIERALAERDAASARRHIHHLTQWLTHGGFAPNWHAFPNAAKVVLNFIGRQNRKPDIA